MDKYEKIALKVAGVVKDYPSLAVKLLLQQWNDETPHFGGGMPHRYDGKSKECSYCLRPKNWKPVNPGFIVFHLPDGEE